MEKNTLALEILRTEKKRTRFWFMAFIITLVIVVMQHFFEKEVLPHE